MSEPSLPSTGGAYSGGVFLGPVAVILLFLVLVITALAVFLIYSAIYRRRVNRALWQETPVGPTPEPRNAGKIILIALAAACVLGFLLWVGALQSRLTELETALRSDISYLSNDLEENYQKLITEMRAENSLFATYDYELVETDVPGHRLTVRFSAEPKASSEATEISLRVGAELFPLTRNAAGVYTGTVYLDPFGDLSPEAVLRLSDDGYVRSEPVEISLEEWRVEYFPVVFANMEVASFETVNERGKFFDRANMTASVYLGHLYSAQGVTDPRSLSLIVRRGDTVLREESLTSRLNQGEVWFEIDCSGDYEHERSKVTDFLVRFEDRHGYIHELTFLSVSDEGSLTEGPWPVLVYDADGTLLGRLQTN